MACGLLQVEELVRRHGISAFDPQVVHLLSRAVDAHFTNILGQVFAMARQRTDADRKRPGMVMSNNLRKKLHEINMREAAAAKQKEAEKQNAALDDTQVGLFIISGLSTLFCVAVRSHSLGCSIAKSCKRFKFTYCNASLTIWCLVRRR